MQILYRYGDALRCIIRSSDRCQSCIQLAASVAFPSTGKPQGGEGSHVLSNRLVEAMLLGNNDIEAGRVVA